MGKVVLTGKGIVLADSIAEAIKASKAKAIGIASAYLTLEGAEFILEMRDEYKIKGLGVIAGLSGAVTHPSALKCLDDEAVDVRFGQHTGGIFHPKILVAGDELNIANGVMKKPSHGYLGSGNFTQYGLNKNLELSFLSSEEAFVKDLADRFAAMWTSAEKLTAKRLAEYEEVFRKRLKKRSPEDLETLEIGQVKKKANPAKPKPEKPVVVPAKASTVWVGLESFTGEHTFQVEFPREAGEVLEALFGTGDGTVTVECADGVSRQMKYKYYHDNAMYRLNVPNDVPLVDWARAKHAGALVVSREVDDGGDERITAEIVRGMNLAELKHKSALLDTLGSTTTRQYGWF